MNTILPNMRLVYLSSDKQGTDWIELIQQIDSLLVRHNLELAEESVYLFFESGPALIAEGQGACRVARAVVGSKKDLPTPYHLEDWVSSRVQKEVLLELNWPELMTEAQMHWERLMREGKKLGRGFILCLSRKLSPDLELSTLAMFHE